MIKWKALCLFIVFFSLRVYSQTRPLSFRNISINEGLSQSSVVDIAIDDAGFVWLATQDGFNRFDGTEFISFQKNFDDITTPTDSRLGRIFIHGNETWLITRGGKLEKFDLYTQAFYSPELDHYNGKLLNSASCIFATKNETWIGSTDQGAFLFQNNGQSQQFTNSSSPIRIAGNHVQQVFRDRVENTWILTQSGVTRIDKKLSAADHFLNAVSEEVACSSIAEDPDGGIWLGTFGKGLWVKSKGESEFKRFNGFNKENQIQSDLVVETILCDRQGRIWIGSFGKGLFMIDPKNSSISHAVYNNTDPYSLGFNDVLAIREDRQGGIWIGTDGGGVSYYDNRLANFETFTRNNVDGNIPIEQVRAITTDKVGNTIIGTSNAGLTLMGPAPQQIPGFKKIGALYTDTEGDIWVGTQEQGLVILDGMSKKVKKRWLNDHTTWCLLENKDQSVWVGTRQNGLYRVDKQKGVLQHLDTVLLVENNIRTLTKINSDTTCIGFETGGIQFINNHNGQIQSAPLSLKKLLEKNMVIRSVCYQFPFLWIGTFGSGLICYDYRSGITTQITEKQGLPNNTIYGIQNDQAGQLWLSTNKGLCRFPVPADPRTISRNSFIVFTSEDGVQANEFNTGAHYRASDGKLYFGGINGFTSFRPSSLSNYSQGVPVVITRVLSDNQPLPTDTVVTYKKLLQLPYSKNSLSFNFAALDVISAGRMKYFYQLVGYDKDWVDAGNRNYVAYTNLPSGNYLFRIKAARDYEMKDLPITSLAIVIQPPYWQKAWFILLCIAIVLGILYAIYRYRISQLIRLQKVRNSIASDLHDEIGSSLTNINILTELSRQNLEKKAEAAMFLGRISEEVNSSGQALDDIVWSINANNDSLDQMVARMRRYVSEMLDSKLESYTIHFDEKFAHRKLSMEQRRDFFLLFKEIINNIHKHSGAKRVEISISVNNNRLQMDVKDDGVGFDPTAQTSRNGIRIMHARADKWKGEIRLNSVKGEGTSIHVSLPVH